MFFLLESFIPQAHSTPTKTVRRRLFADLSTDSIDSLDSLDELRVIQPPPWISQEILMDDTTIDGQLDVLDMEVVDQQEESIYDPNYGWYSNAPPMANSPTYGQHVDLFRYDYASTSIDYTPTPTLGRPIATVRPLSPRGVPIDNTELDQLYPPTQPSFEAHNFTGLLPHPEPAIDLPFPTLYPPEPEHPATIFPVLNSVGSVNFSFVNMFNSVEFNLYHDPTTNAIFFYSN